MTRDSQTLTDATCPAPSSRGRTETMATEPFAVVSDRSITQVMPIANGLANGTAEPPTRDSLPPARGATLVLALEEHCRQRLHAEADEPTKRPEVASGRVQHTLVWPAPQADAVTPAPGHADPQAVNIDCSVGSKGPTTRIARLSEWLPSTALARVATPRQDPCLGPSTTSEDALAAESPRDASQVPHDQRSTMRPAAIIERLAALSRRHKASLAMAPVALLAAVYVLLSPPRSRPATAANQRSPAPMRVPAEAPPASNSPVGPSIASPATPGSMVAPVRSHSPRTLLRQATDAIAEGNYVEARALLVQLQASEPMNPAYGAALRIIDGAIAKSR